MQLNVLGEIVRAEWEKSAAIRTEIELGPYGIMPNHFHGVVVIVGGRGDRPVARTEELLDAHTEELLDAHTEELLDAHTEKLLDARTEEMPDAPTENGPGTRTRPKGPKSKSIGALMAGFKSAVTMRVNQIRNTPGAPVWQRNYWEHVIRDEASYENITAYIENNPDQWEADQLFQAE